MTSSPPSTDTQINISGTFVPLIHPSINPSGTTDPLVSPPLYVTFNTQHVGASSQNPLGIHWPPMTTSGTDLPFTEPMHHPSRPLPFVPFPKLNIPNINTVNQTLNLTPSRKEAMRRNIQIQMALIQQQLNALNQDDNSESKEAATTPRGSS